MPLSFGEYTAWIEVDGEELPIYDVQKKDKEVTGWIPSEAGQTFTVNWIKGNVSGPMIGDVYMDGEWTAGKIMTTRSPAKFTADGFTTSPTTLKPFLFSLLELTDDDEYLNKITAGLGEIKLIISYATFGEQIYDFTPSDLVDKIHERSKKAIGHKVSLGEVKQVSQTPTFKTVRHDSLVTFIFKYRPTDMLRANGVVPRAEGKKRAASPPERAVLDLTRDLADFDNEDERRVNMLREELATLERKRRKTTHVKTEPGVRTRTGNFNWTQ
ncbi:hypothetical protein GYMLUDRAFT_37941 [Collybiopsis luxurians FD-317 M1]|nr:hypothetical protein GYMLUDRAFT_37941 [Collybiopsis luxurians FD-317 M1]